jgi:hypothetical protein
MRASVAATLERVPPAAIAAAGHGSDAHPAGVSKIHGAALNPSAVHGAGRVITQPPVHAGHGEEH